MFNYITAHQAIEDVNAMEAVFNSDLLKAVLPQLTIRNHAQIVSYWQGKSKEWLDTQQYVMHIGRDRTKTMAVRLNEWGLMYHKLKDIFNECKADEALFHHHLVEAGVTRKAWRSKLWFHFSKKHSSLQLSIFCWNGFYESHH